jgi:hypothetical protein
LSKDVAQRFATMFELGQALAAWLMSQGIFEDVAGVSLDSKWMTRSSQTTAQRASRASFASLTGFPPESGVRSAQSALAGAPTVSLELSPVAVVPPPSKPRRQARILIALVVFAIATAAAVLLVWTRESRAPTPSAEAPSVAQPPAPTRVQPAVTTALTTEAPSPAVSSNPASSTQAKRTGLTSPSSRKNAAQPSKAQSQPTTRPSDAQRDLLAPY